jgi:phage terminase large subunit GpA-like protein
MQLGKTLDKMPSGKPIPGGLQLMMLDTGKLKDRYHYRLRSAIEGEGDQPAYVHRETREDYARQILAEEKRLNEKGLQEWIRIRPDNHYLDTECLAMAAADPEWPGGGVHILAKMIEIETARRSANVAARGRDERDREIVGGVGGGYRRPAWMDR